MQFFTKANYSWPYDEALEWMRKAFDEVKNDASKVVIGYGSHEEQVITLGRNVELNNLDKSKLMPSIMVRWIERGGGITAHEPGQLILYPILNIESQNLTVTKLIYLMEEAMLVFLAELGIKAYSRDQGIYIGEEKIGFLGLRIKENITCHGLSLNLLNEAQIFSLFDPCGIKALPITSAYRHTMLNKSLSYYGSRLKDHFIEKLTSARSANGDGQKVIEP